MSAAPRGRRVATAAAAVALAAMGAGAASAADGPVAFELRVDNDTFAFTPPADERWYTSGVFVRGAFEPGAGAADARIVDAWCSHVVGCDPGSRTLRVLSLEHRIHTPAFTGTPAPQPWDRPYAATLALGAAGAVLGGRTRQTLELQLGVLGPAALGDPVQNAIHALFGQPRIDGWEWQVRSQPLVQLGWSRLVRVGTAGAGDGSSGGPAGSGGEAGAGGRGFDAVVRTGVLLGTPVTQASAGALLRFGSVPAAPTWPGESIGTREPAGWQAYVGVEARAVARDETIDGEAYGYASGVRHEPLAGTAFAGASFGAFRDWRIELALAWHTVPFSAPFEPHPNRPQRVGTLGLRWQPRR